MKAMIVSLLLGCGAAFAAVAVKQEVSCPEVMCAMYCEHYQYDENGCMMCSCEEVKCCDPATEPGRHGNPFAIEGYRCCAATGEWGFSIGDGNIQCPEFSNPSMDRFGRRCPLVEMCGGFAGFSCQCSGDTCIDDPRDDCSPSTGGADCSGVCVDTLRPCSFDSDCDRSLCMTDSETGARYCARRRPRNHEDHSDTEDDDYEDDDDDSSESSDEEDHDDENDKKDRRVVAVSVLVPAAALGAIFCCLSRRRRRASPLVVQGVPIETHTGLPTVVQAVVITPNKTVVYATTVAE